MRSWRAFARVVLVLGAVTFGFAASACNNTTEHDQPCPCASQTLPPPVGAPLMAYLSKARAIHHEVDLLEQDDNIEAAASKLEELIASPAPGGGIMPEVQEVVAESQARLADLRGRLGKFDQAEASISAGLKAAPAGSYFEGHLYEVRGLNEQRRAESLAKAGDATGAKRARAAAVTAFERAVEIQDQVVNRALKGDPNAEGRP